MPEKRNTDVERGVKLAYFRASGFFSQIVSVSNYGRKIRNLYLYPSPLLLAFAKSKCMNDYSSTAHIDHMTFPVTINICTSLFLKTGLTSEDDDAQLASPLLADVYSFVTNLFVLF